MVEKPELQILKPSKVLRKSAFTKKNRREVMMFIMRRDAEFWVKYRLKMIELGIM